MKWNFGFNLHAAWKDHKGNQWLEFGPWKDDHILSAICLGNLSSIRKDNKKATTRVLKHLGVYGYK